MLNRRGLITGLISLVAAPAIVRVDSLMKLPKPVRFIGVDYGAFEYNSWVKHYWLDGKMITEVIKDVDFYRET